jgi:hypothetical protein
MNAKNIPAREFARLVEARQLQIERYRTRVFRESGELPSESDPAVDREWLAVKPANGAARCIRIGLLARWARTFDAIAARLEGNRVAA